MSIIKYPVFDNVNQKIREKSEQILNKIEKLGLEGYFYTGYPIFERNDNKRIVPIMFVSKFGLLVFYEDDNDKEDIDSFVMRQTTESTRLKKLYKDKNNELLIFIKIDEFESIDNSIEERKVLLDDEMLKEMNSYLQSSYSMNRKDERKISKKNSLGEVIKNVNTRIATLDETQFDSIYKSTNKHMRIRGLAGSGKTILLVRKMAYLHFTYPELKMAYVFYTVSLKEYITKLFVKFYRDFSLNGDPNFENIKILHGWGSKNREGFYSYLSDHLGKDAKTYSQMFGYSDRLNEASKRLYETIEEVKLQLFDYIFIDEAQDFGLYFFRLVNKSLTSNGKLFYAYDELQTLDSSKSIPTINDIFETDSEDICETINLDNSYRCPNDLLVTAHALGLGIYHIDSKGKDKIINMIEDLSVWQGVGYYVEKGNLEFGSSVTLSRTEDQQFKRALKNYDSVVSESFNDYNNQIDVAANEILRLINQEDVLPDDILVIDLDSINLRLNHINLRTKLLEKQEEVETEKIDLNLVNKDSGDRFARKNEITYTTVFRAKG